MPAARKYDQSVEIRPKSYDHNSATGYDDKSARNIYTIVENCRRLGIAPADYLTDLLERLPRMTAREGNRLTPAAWLAERQMKRRAAA